MKGARGIPQNQRRGVLHGKGQASALDSNVHAVRRDRVDVWKLRSNCPDAEVKVSKRGRKRGAVRAKGLEPFLASVVVLNGEPPHGS